MLHLRITVPAALTDDVLDALSDDPAVSNLAVMHGAAIKPAGDIILADVVREAANEIIDRLDTLGVAKAGTLHVEPVDAWMGRLANLARLPTWSPAHGTEPSSARSL